MITVIELPCNIKHCLKCNRLLGYEDEDIKHKNVPIASPRTGNIVYAVAYFKNMKYIECFCGEVIEIC